MNLTCTIAPFADAMVALDAVFWENYRPDFAGPKFCSSHTVAESIGGYSAVTTMGGFPTVFNSGLAALWLADALGAKKAILLGFDAQKTGGRVHWHGDHKKGMSNASTVGTWPEQSERMARMVSCDVVNCSRQTAITVFRRGDLERELCS